MKWSGHSSHNTPSTLQRLFDYWECLDAVAKRPSTTTPAGGTPQQYEAGLYTEMGEDTLDHAMCVCL